MAEISEQTVTDVLDPMGKLQEELGKAQQELGIERWLNADLRDAVRLALETLHSAHHPTEEHGCADPVCNALFNVLAKERELHGR